MCSSDLFAAHGAKKCAAGLAAWKAHSLAFQCVEEPRAPFLRQRTQLAMLSCNHSIGRTHSCRFSIFIKLTIGAVLGLCRPFAGFSFSDGGVTKIKLHCSQAPAVIEDFVETHLCKLCVILRSRVLRVAYVGNSPCNYSVAIRVNRVMLVSLCAETIKPVLEGDKIYVGICHGSHL